MTLLLSNKLYRRLMASRLLNTVGASIYNLVFIVFASSMPQPKLAIGLADVVLLLPLFFTVFVGVQADKTVQKGRWLIRIGYAQAALFVLVSLLTRSTSYLAFSLVCLLNVLSDILSDYRGGLQMPILQKHVAQEDLMEAYSFAQFIGQICAIGGQALGVWLLAFSQQNFALVASCNALAFLLSSTILWTSRKDLTYNPVEKTSTETPSEKGRFKDIYRNLHTVFQKNASGNFTLMLGNILLINALFSAASPIYNIFLLDHPIFGLSFSQSLLIVQIVMVSGALLGSLTPNDYMAKQSINAIIIWISLAAVGISLTNFLGLPQLIALFLMAFSAYLSGKVNPKIQSMLLTELPSDVLAQASSVLTLLVGLAMPIGTFVFTALSIWNVQLSWLIFLVLAGISLLLSLVNRGKQAA